MKLFLFILLLNISAFSQSFDLTGKVLNEENNPIEGVNVILQNTILGASTNLEGVYQIKNIPSGNYTIVFSAIGFKKKIFENFEIKSSRILNVTLEIVAIEQEQVIVTAGKYRQKISELPVSAEVIPFKDFTERNITNLEDAMRYVPGVNLVDDQLSIRGSSGYSRGAGSRVLMAIDGIPYYTGDTGEIVWESIPVSGIERVEVIKGAYSSLYGSTAIGGVINVITKSITDKPVTYFKSFAGIYDEPAYEIWDWTDELRTFNGVTLSHSNKIDKLGFAASVTRLEDNSYIQNDHNKRYIGFLKANYSFSQKSSLTFLGNSINQKSGNFIYWKNSRNALVPPDADQGQSVTSNRYMGALIFDNNFNSDLSLNIKTSYYFSDWMDESTSMNSSETDLLRGEVQIKKEFNDRFILVSGIEANYSNVNSNIFGNKSAYGFGGYSQIDYKFIFPLTISAGIRYDYSKLDSLKSFSDFSPRVGLNYKINSNLILRTSAGAGFRAPSLAEAFTSTTTSGITVRPNPNIIPERNFTFETGIFFSPLNNLTFDFALFQNEFYNFIEPELRVDNNGNSFAIFDNITRARIQGFEINTTSQLFDDQLETSLSYTYLFSRDLQKEKALKYRPRHIFYVNISYSFDQFSIGSDLRCLSRYEEIDTELADLIIPDGEKRVDIYVLDFRAGYNFFFDKIPLRFSFNVKNILNYNYVELIGNLAPIRNYSLSLELYL